MIGMVLIGCCFGSLNNVFVNMASQNMGNDLRKDMFRKIMTFSFPQIDAFGAGSLITRITNDVTQVERLIAQFVRGMVRTVLMTIGSLYFMFTLSPDFAFIVLGALPFIIGAMYFALRKVNDMLQEDISAIRIIKACVRETYEKLRFGKANDDLIKTQLKVLLTLAFLNPLVNMVMNLSVAAILWYGARDVMEGAASPGSIMAAPEIQDGKFEDKDCSNVSDFSFENADAAGQRSENTTKIINTQGRIEFVNVSFTYPGSQKPVLEHINLTINPGETIAIMGSTGSGKTTLINLIPRFYDVTEGSVRIDGVDVRDYKVSSLRRRIAIALQKSELFSTSIKENIAWGRRESDETNTGTATTCDSKTGTAITDKTKTGTASPDELRGNVSLPNETEPTGSDAHSNTAADADIERAARIAQAHEFIAPLEQGYDTVVAERGMSLSGGQKQRIALARAVLKESPIMIFDDATSALDLKTEANFYNRRANRILILENGEIVAEGTHKELLKSCAIYQDIYQSQVGDIAQHENATQTENANTTQSKASTTSKEADASSKGGERA